MGYSPWGHSCASDTTGANEHSASRAFAEKEKQGRRQRSPEPGDPTQERGEEVHRGQSAPQ